MDPVAMKDLAQGDQEIVKMIRRLREHNHACTLRMLAQTLGRKPTTLTRQLDALQTLGVVDWAPGIPGSLHVVEEAFKRARGGAAARGPLLPDDGAPVES